jgi:hypothetical protein
VEFRDQVPHYMDLAEDLLYEAMNPGDGDD